MSLRIDHARDSWSLQRGGNLRKDTYLHSAEIAEEMALLHVLADDPTPDAVHRLAHVLS